MDAIKTINVGDGVEIRVFPSMYKGAKANVVLFDVDAEEIIHCTVCFTDAQIETTIAKMLPRNGE